MSAASNIFGGDVADWRTAERVLTNWPTSLVVWDGCSSFEPRVVLGATDRAEIEAAACHQPVVARIVTRWPGWYGAERPKLEPRKWPVCAEHLAWHLASDTVRHQLIIGQEPVS